MDGFKILGKMRVCICGGGSLGHVCAGVLGSQPGVEVNMFTSQPARWSKMIEITDPNGKVFKANLRCISSDASQTVAGCDMIFFCLPGFAIERELEAIKPYIGDAIVGSVVCSTGFFFAAHRILGTNAKLFGFQRTPFIARTEEYGKRANLLGYKKHVAIATENIEDAESFRQLVETLWLTPCKLLKSHYEVSMTNSNPILHTGRLYSMWKDWSGEIYDRNTLFYKEWTTEASQIIIDMDKEFMNLLEQLPVTLGSIPSLLDYYECNDARSLCEKIRSIPAFQKITSPMKEVEVGWIPDFGSRYFTEDFPYGLSFIKNLAKEKGVPTPTIDKVYAWGMGRCGESKSIEII